MKIGVMSGVETHLLQIAFDTFKEGTVCDEAEFVMNVQKLKLHCNACSAEFEIDEHRYQCRECESLDVKVIDGEEIYRQDKPHYYEIDEVTLYLIDTAAKFGAQYDGWETSLVKI